MRGEPSTDSRGKKAWKKGVFTYDYKRPARWVDEPDVHLHGWWRYDWAEERHRIASIDPRNHVITLADPQHVFGYRKGMWYYAFNALCEIDRPGEWCIDREAGHLFFWPPSPILEGRVVYTQTNALVTIKNASHITFEGFVFENSRSTAVSVSGGTHVQVRGCTFRNLGGYGVSMYGGTNHRVEGCDIYETGQGGISMRGGNRKTLTPSEHVAENNHIHHFARLIRLLKPGISMGGVGVQARHNLIHNAPHMAIQFSGNDNTIEYNEIHSVCYESNDAGAIYAGRDWAGRGNVIQHNYLHHINGFEGRCLIQLGHTGMIIYRSGSFDDWTLWFS